jgi:hypothetical protein
MNPLFLQILLLVNVFLIGGLLTLAIQHAYAHFKHKNAPESEKPHAPVQNGHLPPAIKEKLIVASQAHFQAVLDRSATELQHDLQITAANLNKQLEKLGSDIAREEMLRYRTSLEQLRTQTAAAISGGQDQIATHQTDLKAKFAAHEAELEAKLNEQIAAEKQQLIQQLDGKLSDAVMSFLTETLQHNVDLGAQTNYLTAMLEEHKAELIKGISDEA